MLKGFFDDSTITLAITGIVIIITGVALLFFAFQYVRPESKKSLVKMNITVVIGMIIIILGAMIGEESFVKIIKDTDREVVKSITKETKAKKVVLCKVRNKSDELKKLCNSGFGNNRVLLKQTNDSNWKLFRFDRDKETGKINIFELDSTVPIENLDKSK